MNDHKFCFIICTNNDLYLSECLHYIDHLIVPEGYEVDILTIQDATSITTGYNEGMHASDAKYKIYMHQDVFILNRNILSDLLTIFQSDEEIGMIGMVGYENVSKDGIMWNTERTGWVYTTAHTTPYAPLDTYQYQLEHDHYQHVAMIDGFFMATCLDLGWDTEHITAWDFYDAFQSMNFLLHGKKIAVPTQHHPWCMHDDNKILNLYNYDVSRQKFIEIYGKYLGKRWNEVM